MAAVQEQEMGRLAISYLGIMRNMHCDRYCAPDRGRGCLFYVLASAQALRDTLSAYTEQPQSLQGSRIDLSWLPEHSLRTRDAPASEALLAFMTDYETEIEFTTGLMLTDERRVICVLRQPRERSRAEIIQIIQDQMLTL